MPAATMPRAATNLSTSNNVCILLFRDIIGSVLFHVSPSCILFGYTQRGSHFSYPFAYSHWLYISSLSPCHINGQTNHHIVFSRFSRQRSASQKTPLAGASHIPSAAPSHSATTHRLTSSRSHTTVVQPCPR